MAETVDLIACHPINRSKRLVAIRIKGIGIMYGMTHSLDVVPGEPIRLSELLERIKSL